MDWRIKALIQKFLSVNKFGDTLNHCAVRLNKDYHRNTFLYQSHETLRKFDCCGPDFNQRGTALEIGTGYSLVSAVVLSLLGFKKIITVDITDDVRFATFKKQMGYLDTEAFLNQVYARSAYKPEEINEKIKAIKSQKSLTSVFRLLSIHYTAPYGFEDIEKYSGSFDYICSQVVLEHIPPPVLEQLFDKTKKWLNKDGYCVHTINFIDHFANPGFFQDKSISEFNFLRYSDKYWSFWSGNAIAYTNRLSYLYYLELSRKYEIEIAGFYGENYRERVALNYNLIHADVIKKYDAAPDMESLTGYQRGTLVLKG